MSSPLAKDSSTALERAGALWCERLMLGRNVSSGRNKITLPHHIVVATLWIVYEIDIIFWPSAVHKQQLSDIRMKEKSCGIFLPWKATLRIVCSNIVANQNICVYLLRIFAFSDEHRTRHDGNMHKQVHPVWLGAWFYRGLFLFFLLSAQRHTKTLLTPGLQLCHGTSVLNSATHCFFFTDETIENKCDANMIIARCLMGR